MVLPLLEQKNFAERAKKVRILAIDFDGVMTDNKVYVDQTGREMVVCSRLEGFGLRRAARSGVYCFILSTEANPVVKARADKLKLDCHQNIKDKVKAFDAILAEHGLSLEQSAFIGNDINDRELLKRVGLPVIVNDAHECLDDLDAFRTVKDGGQGAVRELCDALADILEG